MKDLQAATLKARSASGNKMVGTRVSGGLFQIVEWDGKDNITAISRFMTMQDCIARLNDYPANRSDLMDV